MQTFSMNRLDNESSSPFLASIIHHLVVLYKLQDRLTGTGFLVFTLLLMFKID